MENHISIFREDTSPPQLLKLKLNNYDNSQSNILS